MFDLLNTIISEWKIKEKKYAHPEQLEGMTVMVPNVVDRMVAAGKAFFQTLWARLNVKPAQTPAPTHSLSGDWR
jgi:hypothetical protein